MNKHKKSPLTHDHELNGHLQNISLSSYRIEVIIAMSWIKEEL